MYSLIVNACIILTSITVHYQKKVTSLRNITPVGFENLIMLEKVHYSGNGLWIHCDTTISVVVQGSSMYGGPYRFYSFKLRRYEYLV